MAQYFQNKYWIDSIRLRGYDYLNEGAYFITICTHHKEHYFGECNHGEMQLNTAGLIAEQCWAEIPNHFPNTSIGEFVVMPNHVHGILVIDEKMIVERAPLSSSVATHNYASLHATINPTMPPIGESVNENPKNEYYQNLSAPAKSVSTIMRAYKSAVTVKSKPMNSEFGWQSRFYDHIIRSQQAYDRIAIYIDHNPLNWKEDRFYGK